MPNKNLVVLTGSGISAESGLSTFRDSGGLWEGYDVNEVASIEGWYKNPKKVLDFYNLRREQAAKAQPNQAHKALVLLEEKFNVTIITQNVDDLHERAGSTHVLHLHGELTKARSEKDPNIVEYIGYKPIRLGEKASDGAQLRPAIVWFGEAVPMMEQAIEVIQKADYLLVIGTSLVVYPAAGLVYYCSPETQKYIVDPVTPQIDYPEEWGIIQETACNGVPPLVDTLLKT